MTTLKTIVITSAIALPLGFVATWALKLVAMGPSQAITPTLLAQPMEKNSQAAVDNPNVIALQTEVGSLKADIAALKQEMQSVISKTASRQPQTPSNAKENQRSDAMVEAEEKKLFTKQGEALESDFRQQSNNQAWAQETIDLVKKGLAKDKITESSIISLECRTRSCRLELANNTDKNQAPDFVEFPLYIANVLPNVVFSQTEGEENTTVLYLSKEAFTLPKSEN